MDLSLSLRPPGKILNYSNTRLDRISSLPDEVLSRILSLLPTKDAARTCVLSKTMRRVFIWRTSLEFDDSPISHCLKNPYMIDRFVIFKTFVNSVLQPFQSPYLSKFKLRFGGDSNSRFFTRPHINGLRIGCKRECLPDFEPIYLDAWIHFPLIRESIKEIDLCIHVKEPTQLPPALFTRETLEVLKLDVSLDIDEVCAMPSFNLPNLKTFHLCSVLLPEDSFLTRLVSSCPSLETLAVTRCWWKHGDLISISSSSLRRLFLEIRRPDEDTGKNSEHVLIEAPCLQYLFYSDNVSFHYSVGTMNALVKARLYLFYSLDDPEDSFESLLSLVRGLFNVSHLDLSGSCTEVLDFGWLKDQLPVFHNLKHLELACELGTKWNRLLLEFLKRSPFLETLSFPNGLILREAAKPVLLYLEAMELECEFLTTAQASCSSHLKQFVIEYYWGSERELHLVKFLLMYASVLEALVIRKSDMNPKLLETTLKKLPRASNSCSIHVCRQYTAHN